ncbi:MAG: ABC transporter permease [Candidatus Aminicenantes bacterium]|nr:ABC transporter permease [Candidatus Aminicenantes bacterium]
MFFSKSPSPPRLAFWLIKRLKRYQTNHAIIEDMQEIFIRTYRERGYIPAFIWYWMQCLDAFFKHILFSLRWRSGMFKNYLKSAYRNFVRNRLFSIINTLGLALGLACCILIYIYVSDEFSFDKFHENNKDLYQVLRIFYSPSGGNIISKQSDVPPALGPELPAYFPGIKYQSRFTSSQRVIRYNNKMFRESINMVDTHFFEMFSFKLLSGFPSSVLENDDSIVFTKTYAEKYFGNVDPIGKTVTVLSGRDKKDFIVTGVVENVPKNSTLQFNIVVNISNMSFLIGIPDADKIWYSNWFDTYVQLEPGTSRQHVEARFPAFTSQYFGTFIQEDRDKGKWKGEGNPYSFELQKMEDVHLDLTGDEDNTRLTAIFILCSIAVIVLIIACINYVNLSMGMAASRSKDVGIRKVAGAKKEHLIFQFCSESILTVFSALALGILIASLLLPLFNQLSGKELTILALFSIQNMILMIIFAVLVGAASGIYPAIIMSAFRPVDIFKGKFRLSGRNNIKKLLVVMQFSLSILLIVLSITLGRQVLYLVKKDLGYDKAGLIGIMIQEEQDSEAARRIVNLYRETIRGHKSVLNMTATSSYFGLSSAPSYGLSGIPFHWSTVDKNYMKTLGLRIIAGEDFIDSGSPDPNAAIVNSKFVETFELDSPVGMILGEKFSREGLYKSKITLDGLKIIAVVEDFHYGPLQQQILPSIFFLKPFRDFRIMLVKINTEDIQETVAYLENSWKTIQPDKPFNYYFHEARLESLYNNEKRWSAIISYVSIFTLVIACMGLFGLSLIAVNNRIKEIGIRKVLGAGISDISALVVKEFFILVLISNAVAWPLAFIIIKTYLNNYPYRIDIGINYFLLAGGLSLLISILTLSYNTIRSALRDPVESLRYE